MQTQDETIYARDWTVNLKNKTGSWRASRFIFANQVLERVAFYGINLNMLNFIEGSLKQGHVTASNNLTNWSGTCYITPLIGAFLADSFLGKYRTIVIFSTIYVLGMLLLTFSATIFSSSMKSLQSAFFFVSLYMVALGFGATKPCVLSFGAEQFDETDEKEMKQKSSFFTWVYFFVNVGLLVTSTVLIWVQMNVGWGWGFGIPTASLVVAVGLFFSGSPFYRFREAKGSPFTRIAQVIIASCRKFNLRVPNDSSLLYETCYDNDKNDKNPHSRFKLEHTDQLRFFDKAAVESTMQPSLDRSADGSVNPSRLCSVTQVEELRSVVRILPVWATGIMLNTVFSQMNAIFILQGNRMDPHIGPNFSIPSASLVFFNALGVIVGTPIYDKLVVPFAMKLTGNKLGLTLLQRIGVGLFLSVFSMVNAGVLEVLRLRIVAQNNDYDLEYAPISILWQAPQYFLTGFAEVFAIVGQMDFFYDQAPATMRSMGLALSYVSLAFGNYLSSLLVTAVAVITTTNGKVGWIPENVNRGRLDNFFWLLTILSLINLFIYIFIAKSYIHMRYVEEPDQGLVGDR